MHLIGQKSLPQYPTYFFCNRDLCRAMLPIYSGTPSSTFCQFCGLDEAFKVLSYDDINDLLLYVAYLFSCFGNSKMVTALQPKPISMDFGSPKRREGGVMCGGHGAGLDWPEEKVKFSRNILLIFLAIEI